MDKQKQLADEIKQAVKHMRESPMIQEWVIGKIAEKAGVDLETARKMWKGGAEK